MDKSSPALLTVEDVAVTINDRGKKLELLSDLSFSLDQGKLAVVLGDSGSGKTTLLNVIAGFLRTQNATINRFLPSTASLEGKISVDGDDISTLEPKDRPIGLVMQRFTLYPHMSVRQNLAFPLRMRKVDREEGNEKILSIAKLLKIDRILSRKSEDLSLSGGQAQRVAIGKMILREPKVAMFDEAFSHLDPVLRRELREVVIEHILHGNQLKRRCVIFVSHELADAERAHLIIVLRAKETNYGFHTTHHIFEGDLPGEAWKKMQHSLRPDIIELIDTTA